MARPKITAPRKPLQFKRRKRSPDKLVEGAGKKVLNKTGGKAGRKKIEVNWQMVDNLCGIHATGPEIAEITGISEDTLSLRCKEDHGIRFTDYIRSKRKRGKVSLRRLQWKAAESGDRTMLVWLGKNWLKQTDRLQQKTEVSGTIGPIMIPDNKRDE